MSHRGPTFLILLVVISLLVLLWPLEGNIERGFSKMRPQRAEVQLSGDLPGVYRFLQMAGLNALLADLLWLKADDLWHSASWWEMAPVMETIVRIDPKFEIVWRTLGHHYGWNLHAASTTAVERAFWLQKAADAYERALSANPNSADLWWDASFFYSNRVRQFDKAEYFLTRAVKKFPGEVNTVERALQRVYEVTWQVDKAVATIKDILRKDPNDTLAQRDLRWWKKWDKDIHWRWVLEFKENVIRQTRSLPWYRNPFEGTLVSSPPWRDWDAPMYMNPEWKPDIGRFGKESLEVVFGQRRDLAVQWQKAHPNERLPVSTFRQQN